MLARLKRRFVAVADDVVQPYLPSPRSVQVAHAHPGTSDIDISAKTLFAGRALSANVTKKMPNCHNFRQPVNI